MENLHKHLQFRMVRKELSDFERGTVIFATSQFVKFLPYQL